MTRTKVGWTVALLLATGCDARVVGGGGGGEPGSGGASASGSESTAAPVSGSTSSAQVTSAGGGGASNALGECVDSDASAVSGGGPDGTTCSYNLDCAAGPVLVECAGTADGGSCDCSLGGELRGTCDMAGWPSCFFPDSCCYALLGGNTTPRPGPYGNCGQGEASAVAASGPGGADISCINEFQCEAGSISVSCRGSGGPSGGAVCECDDPSGLLLGTCEQEEVTCDYEQSCCYAVFNP